MSVKTRVRCRHCGEAAPYGDERFAWMRWHDSSLHRLLWKFLGAVR